MTSISSTSEPDDEKGDLFQGMMHCQKSETSHRSSGSKAKAITKMWLEAVLKKEDDLSDLAFRKVPGLQHMFAKFNISVLSSASGGCMFLTGKDMLHTKRPTLSDGNLERLVFVKGTTDI